MNFKYKSDLIVSKFLTTLAVFLFLLLESAYFVLSFIYLNNLKYMAVVLSRFFFFK